MKKKQIIAMLTAFVALSVSTASHAGWSIYGLGTLGGISSAATGINESGQISGTFYLSSGVSHAFTTGADGASMRDLGTLGGTLSLGSAINNSGQVVGASYITGDVIGISGGPTYHAFLTGNDGIGMVDLGGPLSYAMDLNNDGKVVGQATFGTNYVHSFITGSNGVGMTDMGTLGGNKSSALGINDSGQVVGWSEIKVGSNVYHAFITGPNGVGMTDLDTFENRNSLASDINNNGIVVGGFDSGDGNRAFVTGVDGIGMVDLGTFGGRNSFAIAINDYNQVVGSAMIPGNAGGNYHGFIYSNDVMVDLDMLEPVISAGWTNLSPLDINNNGQIVGEGLLNGVRQAFLLSGADDEDFFLSYVPPKYEIPTLPVPEPSVYAMLLLGLVMLGFTAHCKKESASFN